MGLEVKTGETKVGVDKIGEKTKGRPKLVIFRADCVLRSDGKEIDRRLVRVWTATHVRKKLGSLNVETCISIMGIYLIRMVISVETKRMRGTKVKIGRPEEFKYEFLVNIFSDPRKCLET